MHPNPLFQSDDYALLKTLVDEIVFGTMFVTTPDGPRVAHTPVLLSTGGETVRFHLARGNVLTRNLDGATALVSLNGPHAYVSPRWYDNRDAVPTWDYVAIEMEGLVQRMANPDLEAFLHELIKKLESHLGDNCWSASEASEARWEVLFKGIIGYEMTITAWRSTLKLSQKRSLKERTQIIEGHRDNENLAMARIMQKIVS